ESIAAFELAALITALEPALALGRGAVSEGVRHDIALRLLLDLVVADRARRIQRVVDIAGLDDVFTLLGVIGEDAGEAIGLQFDAHLQSIRLGLAHALPHRLHLIHDAEQLLHVMANLVGDDIGLREIALYAEAVLQLLVEVEVNINLLVVGTVEGTHCRHAGAAGRADRYRIEHELRLAIGVAVLAEDVLPDVLGVGEHHADELPEVVLARR